MSRRHHFLDKSLLYLFSYNTEAEAKPQIIGRVPDGVRFNESNSPGESRVYHVLREKVEGGLGRGFSAISGRILTGTDYALFRSDDVVVDEIRLVIETDDGALIGSRYRGTAYLRPGGFNAFVMGIDKLGREGEPAQLPLVITPQYETGDDRYKWLMEYQCVGFGRADVIKNEIRRLTLRHLRDDLRDTMAQSNMTPPLDLRALRTSFFPKETAYALSFDYQIRGGFGSKLGFASDAQRANNLPNTLRIQPHKAATGEVYHVLRRDRVPGLDKLGRDLPNNFEVVGVSERVVFRALGTGSNPDRATGGVIDGRMVLQAPKDGPQVSGEPLRISITYDGTLRLPEPMESMTGNDRDLKVIAQAFVTLFFETTHPKYHWLTENACIAYGTWELSEEVVTASFDVYCAE